MSYLRPVIDQLNAYEPGEQPPLSSDVIKLNTNENPYLPSNTAMKALKMVDPDRLRRYPQPLADEFRQSAARVLKVDPEWILVGNGSDDLLTMLFRSMADTERSVAYPVPTYVLYRTLAEIQGAPVVEVPFDDDYTLPVDTLARAGASLTLVANPNSPSGTRAPNTALAELAARVPGVLAIDEAYVAFAAETALALVQRFPNVIILRTLSKSHSLAGLRLGFAIAQPALLDGLAKVKDSYNVDVVAALVGAAAILDTEHTLATVERIRRSRARLSAALGALGFRVWPSEANFLLIRPADGNAKGLYGFLKTNGILVRYFQTPPLNDKLRITVGTDRQNDRLIAAISAHGLQ
jgi:histidinol-phosphate aminotransferase